MLGRVLRTDKRKAFGRGRGRQACDKDHRHKKWYEHIGINFKTPSITVYLPKTEYDSLLIDESTGDIEMPQGFTFESVDVSLSTGDVRFDGSDAAELFVKTNTGDVTGTLLSQKVFIANTDTGNVKVPSSITGGRCEITTCTGNIKITVQQ